MLASYLPNLFQLFLHRYDGFTVERVQSSQIETEGALSSFCLYFSRRGLETDEKQTSSENSQPDKALV